MKHPKKPTASSSNKEIRRSVPEKPLIRGKGSSKDDRVEKKSLQASGPQEVAVPLETKDRRKFDNSRRLSKFIDEVRENYRKDLESNDPKERQRAVALYFIDMFVFRSGHEKKRTDKSESAGCCLLKKKHVKLLKNFIVEFHFKGKHSIPYHKIVEVEKKVYENLEAFLKGKSEEDYVFHLIGANFLNAHLKSIMDGLTSRVFRTYHASQMMEKKLAEFTRADDNVSRKIASFKKANNEVSIILNHKCQVADKGTKKKEKRKTKDEEFETGLETSIMYYIDPRIVVSWCRKWNIPVKKVYCLFQLEKFDWAMSAKADFKF